MELIQIDSVTFGSTLVVNFLLHLFLSIWNNLLSVCIDCIVTSVDVLLQTVIKTCLPNIDHFVRPSSDEVISLSAELSRIGMGLKGVFQPSFLTVPNLSGPIFRRTDQKRTMRMKINTFNRSLMSLIHLNHMLRSQIIQFYLLIMRTRCNTISQ